MSEIDKNLFVSAHDTIKNSLKKIDLNAERIVFVVDDKNSLMGALSDGDLRRIILKGMDINSSIISVYNKKPVFLKEENFNYEKCKDIFLTLKITVIPVVDEQNIITRVITWDDVFSDKTYKLNNKISDIPLIIMAGGKGTRMAPFTNILPKPLIPIGEKTILELIIDRFLSFGIMQYNLIVNYRGEMIKAYFDSIEKKYELNYVWEKEFNGTAGSLKLLEDSIHDTFIVTNCDIIVKADYADVVNFHKKNNAFVTIISSIQHHKIPYGVIEFENGGVVTGIQEKPEFSFSINTGVYVLQKEALSFIKPDQVFHMTDLIESLIKENKKVVTYPVNENDYVDIGQWEEYHKTVEKFSSTNWYK